MLLSMDMRFVIKSILCFDSMFHSFAKKRECVHSSGSDPQVLECLRGV